MDFIMIFSVFYCDFYDAVKMMLREPDASLSAAGKRVVASFTGASLNLVTGQVYEGLRRSAHCDIKRAGEDACLGLFTPLFAYLLSLLPHLLICLAVGG